MLDAATSTISPDTSFDLETAISEHLPRLRRRAVRMCRSEAEADDVVQDALVRALRGRHQLRSADRAGGWLLAIVSTTFIDRTRRRRARPLEVELAVEPAAVTDATDDEQPWAHLSIDDVRAAVAGLPDDVRDTYRMFALEGRDYNAIVAALGVPKATVGTRIHRARRQLKAALEALAA